MENKIHNQFVQLEESFDDFLNLMSHKGFIDTIKNPTDTLLSWENIIPNFTLQYNSFIIDNLDIKKRLIGSKLSDYEFLIMDWGVDANIVKIKVETFINNWEYIVHFGGSMGRLLTTEDYSLVMEFTDDSKFLCYSNFKI